MTMNVTHLRTYWTTEEAATVIDFLDNLRDILWESYEEEIAQMLREASEDKISNRDQELLLFDDELF